MQIRNEQIVKTRKEPSFKRSNNALPISGLVGRWSWRACEVKRRQNNPNTSELAGSEPDEIVRRTKNAPSLEMSLVANP